MNPAVFAKNLYVNNSGSPACSDATTWAENSAGSPWCTIGRAAWGSADRSMPNASQAAQAGDTVIVRAGTYNASASSEARYQPAYNPANSGTIGAPIVFLADGVVSLRSTIGTGPVIGAESRNYIVWDGFYIDEDFVNTRSDTAPVIIWSATGVTIQNMEINGKAATWADNHSCIRLEYANNATIRNNKLYGNYSQSNFYNQSAIIMYHTASALIENNEIYDSGGGIFVKGLNTGPVTIRRNLIYNVTPAITFGGINDQGAVAYQNIIRNSLTGIIFIGYDSVSPQNVQIVNNTIVNEDFGVFPKPGTTGYRNLVFRNNIIAYNNYAVAGEDISDVSNMSFSHNVYFSYPTSFARINYTNYSFAAWQSTYGKDTVGSITSDPQFVNYGGNDFHLQPGSPARTVGVDILDIDGDGSATDVIPAGAYVTGNEVIGTGAALPGSPPSPPRGLQLR